MLPERLHHGKLSKDVGAFLICPYVPQCDDNRCIVGLVIRASHRVPRHIVVDVQRSVGGGIPS